MIFNRDLLKLTHSYPVIILIKNFNRLTGLF